MLDASGRLVAPIPLSSVSQAAYPGKGDVLIQFFDEDTAEREDECLIEMRLHVPAEHKLEGAEEGVEMARKKAADKVRVGGASPASACKHSVQTRRTRSVHTHSPCVLR